MSSARRKPPSYSVSGEHVGFEKINLSPILASPRKTYLPFGPIIMISHYVIDDFPLSKVGSSIRSLQSSEWAHLVQVALVLEPSAESIDWVWKDTKRLDMDLVSRWRRKRHLPQGAHLRLRSSFNCLLSRSALPLGADAEAISPRHQKHCCCSSRVREKVVTRS